MIRLNRMSRPQAQPLSPILASDDNDAPVSANAQRRPSDPGTIGKPAREAIVARVFAQARACRAWTRRLGDGKSSLGFGGLSALA
jgi:hypothetical protein